MPLMDKVVLDFKNGLTKRQIAEKHDLSYRVVCRIIKRNKIVKS